MKTDNDDLRSQIKIKTNAQQHSSIDAFIPIISPTLFRS